MRDVIGWVWFFFLKKERSQKKYIAPPLPPCMFLRHTAGGAKQQRQRIMQITKRATFSAFVAIFDFSLENRLFLACVLLFFPPFRLILIVMPSLPSPLAPSSPKTSSSNGAPSSVLFSGPLRPGRR